MYTSAKLIQIERNRIITKDEYFDFFYELQRGVLLALKEDSLLNEMQYRYADDALKEQRKAVIRANIEGGNVP